MRENRAFLNDAQIKHAAQLIRLEEITHNESTKVADSITNKIHALSLMVGLKERMERLRNSRLNEFLNKVDGETIKDAVTALAEQQKYQEDKVETLINVLASDLVEPGIQPTSVDPEVTRIYNDLISEDPEIKLS